MHRPARLRPSPALVVASVSLVVALGGVAYASAGPSSSSPSTKQIRGCLSLPSRVMYVPAEGFHCHAGDIPIDWNQAGPKGAPGQTGKTGKTGPRGAAGATGATGLTGAKGEAGLTGAKGEAGLTGAKGETGLTGAKGETGLTGAKGEAGLTGAKGETGLTGPIGQQGLLGETGTTGAKGEAGADGTNGLTVLHGSSTPSESEGIDGDFYIDTTTHSIYGPKANETWTGTGPTSLVGSTGPEGPVGPEGIQGNQGEKGETGSSGISGYEVVHNSVSHTLENGQTVDQFVTVECPSGKHILGGGAYAEGVGGELINDGPLVESGTVYDIWEAFNVPRNESGSTQTSTLTAVVYCANVS